MLRPGNIHRAFPHPFMGGRAAWIEGIAKKPNAPTGLTKF